MLFVGLFRVGDQTKKARTPLSRVRGGSKKNWLKEQILKGSEMEIQTPQLSVSCFPDEPLQQKSAWVCLTVKMPRRGGWSEQLGYA